jgi:cation diffusion facilitator CzcD-associated flavoprotein CzcO
MIEPHDAFNRALVDNVHPAAWTDPEPAPRYNLVVIGGGTSAR